MPFLYPSVSLGRTIIQFPLAIEDTAFDLLNPAGEATICPSNHFHVARMNRVKGFFFGKSSPNRAVICGKYGVVFPIIYKMAGRVYNSNPVKQADGFPNKPNSNLFPNTAAFLKLPGRIITLLNKTFAPSRL